VLQYLGRYTHRVAISNHRLVSLVDGQVTFRWRDSAHNNEQKVMTLSLDEFLAPLPPASASQGLRPHPPRRLPRQSPTLHTTAAMPRSTRHSFIADRTRNVLRPAIGPCLALPKCGGPMAVIERLTAAQLQLCSPPPSVTTAA
jgi:hypothetical protein